MTHTTGIVIGASGLAVALWAGWFVVRGPFFGHPIPPLEHVLLACGIFIVGTYVFAWGVDASFQLYSEERPDISEKQDHTLDTPYGPR